uniref:H-2 class II histocompatibility antigen, A-U alpha chain-like n=1 Tax=Kryptolebias marmoratus TaxID=37003 RepID=A0A3Q3AH28_KRYMA
MVNIRATLCFLLNTEVLMGQNMKLYGSALLSVLHESYRVDGCSETDGTVMLTLDGEEVWHADFKHNTGVNSLPDFVQHPSSEGLYELAVLHQRICKNYLPWIRMGLKDIPTALDPPNSLIFTAHRVELGVENTLICSVFGFYPAPVRVHWTRNGLNVTDGTSINVPFPHKDQTFSQISRLDFLPQLGDTYSCTVDHVALTEPQRRIWDVQDEAAQPGIGPSVFCGVGLTVGLLGVAVGTFFLIKGNECR